MSTLLNQTMEKKKVESLKRTTIAAKRFYALVLEDMNLKSSLNMEEIPSQLKEVAPWVLSFHYLAACQKLRSMTLTQM